MLGSRIAVVHNGEVFNQCTTLLCVACHDVDALPMCNSCPLVLWWDLVRAAPCVLPSMHEACCTPRQPTLLNCTQLAFARLAQLVRHAHSCFRRQRIQSATSLHRCSSTAAVPLTHPVRTHVGMYQPVVISFGVHCIPALPTCSTTT